MTRGAAGAEDARRDAIGAGRRAVDVQLRAERIHGAAESRDQRARTHERKARILLDAGHGLSADLERERRALDQRRAEIERSLAELSWRSAGLARDAV